MRKALRMHEIRDPIHVFVRMDSDESKVVNSPQFQRLRQIHQLAFTSYVYPGATHRRFEHCLGVMELAGRIYDIITDPENVHPEMRYLVPQREKFDHSYWRRVLRIAALCHDLGHLPFSHAAEHLLPDGVSHEDISREIILHSSMAGLWDELKVQPIDVAKLAVGPKHIQDPLDEWETILYEIIGGDVFGADRIDYLLRDSYHAGVAYGHFDHFRLIDTLRILPKAEFGPEEISSQLSLDLLFDDVSAEKSRKAIASREPVLGLEQGGLQSAESLLWARYFMYTQVYSHHVRRIYDIHLAEFLQAWLPNGHFSPHPDEHLHMTDNEVMGAILASSKESTAKGHQAASRIVNRTHFRRIYEGNRADNRVKINSFELVYDALGGQFSETQISKSVFTQKSGGKSFPVLTSSGNCENSINVSDTLAKLPVFTASFIYADPTSRNEILDWLRKNKVSILA